ncbi:MAG: AAA family ATPase [Planctomycetota bacterium]
MTTNGTNDLEALLRRLLADDEFERQAALEELRQRPSATLVTLVDHSIDRVRVALARAIAGRNDPIALDILQRLADDTDCDVRQALAEAIKAHEGWVVSDELLVKLARDEDSDVAAAAVPLLARRRTLHPILVELLARDDVYWGVRKVAASTLGGLEEPGASALVALITAVAEEDFEPLARECAGAAERRVLALRGAPPASLPAVGDMNAALAKLRGWRGEPFPNLRALLAQHEAAVPNLAALATFGKDLTAEAERGRLTRGFQVDEQVAALMRVLEGNETRSAVLIGATGVGKTAIVNELVHRLARHPAGPWRVIRIVPSELLVGTKYLGEWQTRVKELIELAAAPQRVLLYVPNLQELSDVGKASNDQSNVATMLAPHIEGCRIALIGEATPEGWARGLGGDASLRRLFARVDVPPMGKRDAREVLELVAAEAEVEVAPDAFERLFEVAEMYLSETELPGRAVGLLRRMTLAADSRRYSASDVLRTLHDATGVPADFLDDAVPLRRDVVQAFFEARVMGQPSAIERVLDLVTLVKAGLADPQKPSGVMLFVGPTGVGKTELARALAELLFGDPQRLLRFDMSEYASYDSYERLIGSAQRQGLLTEGVRQQPFSVVLLDEIEKAHGNVFDLCLQIFDAGRLTDGQGRTVSFRRALIILTSNLGAKVQTEASIGFGADGKVKPQPDDASILATLGQFFRPEFLGRIDHLVVFSPLSPETADRIARREVERVLARSGITRRKVSVDVDPGVYAVILRRGYSPALGARPLKRAVESMLLLPIARVLAERGAQPGACLRLRARGDAIDVSVVAPVDDAPKALAHEPTPELTSELQRATRLRERAHALEERRADLLERTHAPGFWDTAEEAAHTFDTVHRIDRLLEDLAQLESNLQLTATNLDKRRASRYLELHANDARRLERLFDAPDLGDAFVRISRVRSLQGGLEGVERLARMYVAWARRTRIECEVLDDRCGHDNEDTITLALYGAGAFALLEAEAGLHRLSHEKGEGRSATDLVRVDVLAAVPERRVLRERDVRAETRPLHGPTGRLATTVESDVHLLHVPSMTSLRAASPLSPSDAVAPLRALLAAIIAADAERAPGTSPQSDDLAVVRRYQFGGSPVVRDRRTGRSTGRIDRVLGGELELVT